MIKIIRMIKASDADDLNCADGELLDADYMFEGEGTPLPEGADWLGMHGTRSDGTGTPRAVIRLPSGRLAFSSDRRADSWRYISPESVPAVSRMAVPGPWLCCLTASGILYARWNGTAYDWMGSLPDTPETIPKTEQRVLPPYSSVSSALPRLTVSAAVSDSGDTVLDWLAGRSATCSPATRQSVIGAVKAAIGEFLEAVAAAGLFLSPVMAAVAWRLPDGTLWRMGAPHLLGDSEPVTLRIAAADCPGALLSMTLELSRIPFAVVTDFRPQQSAMDAVAVVASAGTDFSADTLYAPVWLDSRSRGFTLAAVPLSEDDFGPFPEVRKAMCTDGLPDDIFAIAGRLYALCGSSVEVSERDLPFVQAQSCPDVVPSPVVALTGSLASSQKELAPLFAFCLDGIHSLTVGADGRYRDSRLLSRHIPIGSSAIAPLPDGTAFLSEAGIMKLSGSTVRKLAELPPSLHSEASAALLYIYGVEALVAYRPGGEAVIYKDDTPRPLHGVRGVIDAHHYAWPEVWILLEGKILPLSSFTFPLSSSSPGAIVPIRTRPLKLTDAFSVKKVEEVHALWPDGSRLPLRLYGAMKPGRWHYLGTAREGRMILRGSGWRLFRFDTYAVADTGGFLLPTVRIKVSAR